MSPPSVSLRGCLAEGLFLRPHEIKSPKRIGGLCRRNQNIRANRARDSCEMKLTTLTRRRTYGVKRQFNATNKEMKAASEVSSAGDCATSPQFTRADDLVRYLWTELSLKDMDVFMQYFAEDVVYEDLIYKEAFRGKAAVQSFMQKNLEAAPEDLKFVLERISDGERSAGFTWHCEIDGVPEVQFARGCSFYELNDDGLICYVRDIPEPALKLGSFGLVLAKLASKALVEKRDKDAKRLQQTLAQSEAYAGVDVSFTDDPQWVLSSKLREKARLTLSTSPDPIRTFFEIAGFGGGNGVRVKWGVLREKVDDKEIAEGTEESRASLRARAAEQLVNIDLAERERRSLAGRLVLAATAVSAVGLFATAAPLASRAALFFPFSLGLGFYRSGESGL